MNDTSKGLVTKYNVTRTDGRPMKGPAIVLEWGDSNSLPALRTWAATVRAKGFANLADDVESRLELRETQPSYRDIKPENMHEVFAAILALELFTREQICRRINWLLDDMKVNQMLGLEGIGDPRGLCTWQEFVGQWLKKK